MKTALLTLAAGLFLASGQQSARSQAPAPLDARNVGERLAHSTTDERIQAYRRLAASAPGNVVYQSGLVQAYFQKLRETQDFAYLDRVSKIVDQMLERDNSNPAAMRFQNEVDLQRHEFTAVAERAADMVKYSPSDSGLWSNLGDALMELGEYQRASQAYAKMFALGPNLGSYNRAAYFRFVNGDANGAIALMNEAVEAGSASPENVAWCRAELGDMYLKTGQFDAALKSYRAALDLFPTLHRAYAGIGKVLATQGEIEAAIHNYERAQSIVPMVEYAGALEDLYLATGSKKKAQQQSELVDAIEKLGAAANEKTNRNLALVLADHDRRIPRALALMQAEIPGRGDVYTWDALAWVLFKAGQYQEAQAAMAKALRLNTPEPRFYYHASKIERAAGDGKLAALYLQRLTAVAPKAAQSPLAP